MKLKLILVFSLFIWLSSNAIQAQIISGKIVSQNNEAIPFATIQIGNTYGVISNEEGNFSIDRKKFKDQDTVTISCLGFEKKSMLLKDFSSKNYTLNEKVNELSEVYLTNKPLSIDSIMYYVNSNLKTNYRYHQNEFKVFSRKTEYIVGKNADFEITKSTGFRKRQLEAFNNDFDKLETSLLNNKSKQYTDFIGDLKILNEADAKLHVEKAIRLLDESNNQSIESLAERGQDIVMKHLDKNKLYTVKSGLFKISDSVTLNKGERKMEDTINSLGHVRKVTYNTIRNNNFLNPTSQLDFVTNTKKYEYTIRDITFMDSEMVYIVDFKPKRASVKYTGTMYISNESFAVLRADYRFYKGRVGEKLNLRLILGVKYIERNKKGVVVFKQDEDGYYYPSYTNEQIDRYFYVNRPIKFIENNNRSNKVAFNFKIEGTFKEKSELLVLSRKELGAAEYNSYSEKQKINYSTPKTYDASIWSDYNVLEPLDEMKNFKIETEE